MKKVVKFGGSSLASAEQFKKVGSIIRKEESRRYVDVYKRQLLFIMPNALFHTSS